MGTDVIILVRHGKPALSRKVQLDWRGYREWWKLYDAGGLADEQKMPPKVAAYAKEADIVISSPLPRAVESAVLARGSAPDMTDKDLVEASLPPPHLGSLTFRPKTWGTFARICWWCGWTDEMESHESAKKRSELMATKLEDHAKGGKMVFVTAHGWYNRMLKGRLKNRGWKCVFQNGDLHWSYRRFERITDEG